MREMHQFQHQKSPSGLSVHVIGETKWHVSIYEINDNSGKMIVHLMAAKL